MTKRFKAIPGPFGGVDEQATTNAFEVYVGGVNRAQNLFRIYKNSYPSGNLSLFDKPLSKAEVFRKNAKREGFTNLEVDAFLLL